MGPDTGFPTQLEWTAFQPDDVMFRMDGTVVSGGSTSWYHAQWYVYVDSASIQSTADQGWGEVTLYGAAVNIGNPLSGAAQINASEGHHTAQGYHGVDAFSIQSQCQLTAVIL